jgi:hypothetical protein
MPRQRRLDAPGVLHQVRVRGMERRTIFRDEADHAAVVARRATSVTGTGLTVYAWALLPNHAHLLVRTRPRPLSHSMRRLLIPPCGTPSIGAITAWATSSASSLRRSRPAARRGAATAGRWRPLLTECQAS